MSTEENKAIVRRLWEEFYQGRDAGVLDELFADDYVFRFAATGWRAREGREGYKGGGKVWWGAFPDLSFNLEKMFAEGDLVVAFFTLTGTQQGDWTRGPNGVTIKATGRPLNLPDIVVYRIHDGKIVEEWESLNEGSLWQQLGAI